MKKLALIISFLSLLAIPVATQAADYVGNRNSMKFHYTSCTWAQKIIPANRVSLNSRQDGVNRGYTPCKICKP